MRPPPTTRQTASSRAKRPGRFGRRAPRPSAPVSSTPIELPIEPPSSCPRSKSRSRCRSRCLNPCRSPPPTVYRPPQAGTRAHPKPHRADPRPGARTQAHAFAIANAGSGAVPAARSGEGRRSAIRAPPVDTTDDRVVDTGARRGGPRRHRTSADPMPGQHPRIAGFHQPLQPEYACIKARTAKDQPGSGTGCTCCRRNAPHRRPSLHGPGDRLWNIIIGHKTINDAMTSSRSAKPSPASMTSTGLWYEATASRTPASTPSPSLSTSATD